jgi:hypothetical protein
MSAHGTHVASMIFGQPGSDVRGIAPASYGLLATIYSDLDERPTLQMDLAQAIDLALDAGAHVINISGGELSNSGFADPVLASAVRNCHDQGVLIVAAAGNDACQCLHVPAALPSVLAVGAMDERGLPLESSNWGDIYQAQGVLAPGQNMLGAVPGGGTALKSGTSYAAPVVTGIVALLLSWQLARGEEPDPLRIGNAILASALPCNEQLRSDCLRFLAGRLNIPGARDLISSRRRIAMSDERSAGNGSLPSVAYELGTTPMSAVTPQEASEAGAIEPSEEGSATLQSFAGHAETDQQHIAPSIASKDTSPNPLPRFQAARAPRSPGVNGVITPSRVAASCGCKANGSRGYVYAIGSLNYDFGTEARRDSFKLMMPGVSPDGLPYLVPSQPLQAPTASTSSSSSQPVVFPPNPYDARQMVNYLGGYPPPQAPYPTQGGFPMLPPYPPSAPTSEPYPESVPLFPPPYPPAPDEPPNYTRGYPAHLSEATELIWTLNIEQTPVYALRPSGPFSTEAYQRLVAFLAGQVRPVDDDDYVSRVSIPGVLTSDTVQLFSGQVVPVLIPNVRGMYAWNERQLIKSLMNLLKPPSDHDFVYQMHDFLNRVYYELRNLGQTSAERALNYAASNAFQVGDVLVRIAERAANLPESGGQFALNSITVTKSAFCRIDSDCWDVNVSFFYPQNIMYASDLFSFTVDVSDSYPVPIGQTRHWSVPTFSS